MFGKQCALSDDSGEFVSQMVGQGTSARAASFRVIRVWFCGCALHLSQHYAQYEQMIYPKSSEWIFATKSEQRRSGRRWTIGPGCDGTSITLAAAMNGQNSEVEALFVLPGIPNRRFWVGPEGAALLKSGIRLDRLSDFCTAVRTVSDHKPSPRLSA